MRQTWDETWLEVAVVVARRSLCVRAQVGCVVVNAHNRIAATGYNGPPSGFRMPRILTDDETSGQFTDCKVWCPRADKGPTSKTVSTYDDCPSLHAELNALSVCDRTAREGGTIYITGHPCFACTKMIANSGLSCVVVKSASADYRMPERSYAFLKDCGLAVILVDDV
jgi:dCMP deaminase